MSKFYGQVFGASNTSASRRGHSEIHVSAQSYDGSVITRMFYDRKDRLIVDIQMSDGSSSYGDTVFHGTFDDLKKKLGGAE